MLMAFLKKANVNFEDMQSDYRFTEDISGGDDVYSIYMAKKKTGKPKDDYPSKWIILVLNVGMLSLDQEIA